MWADVEVGERKLLIRHILLVFYLLGSYPSFAHVPVLHETDSSADQPFILKRPYNQSIAIYTHFASQDDLDVYEFEVSEKDLEEGPIDILVGTLVPACQPLAELLVSWVLVGPKQKALNNELDAGVLSRLRLSDQEGILLVANKEQGEIWREPYTAHYYFRQARKKLKLSKTGLYKVLVWPSGGKRGDYVFEFGDKEIWSITDILHTLWVYPKLLFEEEIVTGGCVTSDMK